MKSIIIIIVIFLLTLAAKAEWVKSGELDSLSLGNSSITFSKYSQDNTKFVTYSAQDSTLRLWDLQTGKVIKERTFDWSYNFDVCEFDFDTEQFYMVKNIGKIYPGSVETTMPNDPISRLWKIDFSGKITFTNIIAGGSTYISGGKYPTVAITWYFCKMLLITDKYLILNYDVNELTIRDASSPNETSSMSYYFRSVSVNKTNNKPLIHPTDNFQANGYRKYGNNLAVSYNSNNNQFYKFGFNDTLEKFAKFEKVNFDKNYPNYLEKVTPLDMNFNTLAYNDSSMKVKFYSRELDQVVDLGVPISVKDISNFKLISSMRYSLIYFKNLYFLVCDNQEKKIIDSVVLPNGYIGYSAKENIIYSAKGNYVLKTNLKFNQIEYDFIYSNKSTYVASDTIILNKNYNPNDSNLIWTVNGKSYNTKSPKISNLNSGFYKVKLEFMRDGKNIIIEKDSLIKVLDSLSLALIPKDKFLEITKPTRWSYKEKFRFIAKFNLSDGYKYRWLVNNEIVSDKMEFDYLFKSCRVNKVKLEVSTDFITKTEETEVVSLQDFQPTFSTKTGSAPLQVVINSKYSSAYDYSAVENGSTYAYFFLGNSQTPEFFLNFSQVGDYSDTLVFAKEGVYNFQIKNTLDYPNQLKYYSNYEKFIVVLAPSDVKTLENNKYLIKEYSDGIYCRVEGEGEATLYDNIGRLVKMYLVKDEIIIRKEEFSQGVYFLRLNVNNEIYHEKFIVE